MNKVIKTTNCALVSTMLLSCSFLASAEQAKGEFLNGTFSGSAGIATDSVFRGESTVADGDTTAIFANFTWSHSSGFYAGVSGATAEYESTPDIRSNLSPYLGKSGTIGESGISYNVFVYHYTYADSDDSNYTELWMQIAKDFGPVNMKLEVTPTLDDWFGAKGWDGVNYAIHPSTSFSNGINLSGSLGYQDLSGDGAEGWGHWNLGVSKNFYGLNFDVRYHDSNIDSSHKVYGSEQGLKIFDSRFVLGVSKSF
ncbi:TorF family putative porin [Thalassotalea atypica]|uniref:TorF family putative porin n=1 Tax=Thalassotalea atypica TaxID=2054316 RepID=UPI002572F5E5|nr:TorF family putative porin [Thalassotalea atypica]